MGILWSGSRVRSPFSESPPLGKMRFPPAGRLIARRIAMPALELSRAARDVLHRLGAGESVDVTPASLEAYRELSSLAVGREPP
jgi:hypothetical protein